MSNEKQVPPPPAQMMQRITGFWISCSIYTAAKLNIADLLAKNPQTAEQLAAQTNTHAPSLYRLLRALASEGIFTEDQNGAFSNTPLGDTLQDGVPGSMKAMVLAQLGDHFKAWGNLEYSVKTGGIAFDNVEGKTVWEYYEENEEDGINFMKAMSGLTGAVIKHVLPAYNFSQFKSMVDIGGGNGALMMALLDASPDAKGIVFDEEYVINETQKIISDKGYGDRCSAQSGNFFESVPENADVYTMKLILHDWNDDKSIQILTNISSAMNTESKLLIFDAVIPGANLPHPGKFLDLNMLAMTGGKERTEEEFAALLEQSGLKITQVIPTHTPMFSIIEAAKA